LDHWLIILAGVAIEWAAVRFLWKRRKEIAAYCWNRMKKALGKDGH
jgi:hypothetical protein